MPRAAVVLGSGGGARAVVHGLVAEGFQRIVVFNRHLHRAEALVRFFARSAAHMELRAMPWHESIIEAELAKAKVLVNATAVGLHERRVADPGRADPARPPGHGPRSTTRRSAAPARRGGGRLPGAMNGELMLLHQGAAAFTLWTGQPAPLELMHEKLTEGLAVGGAGRRRRRAADEGAGTAGEPGA